MSAPHACGVAALLESCDSSLSGPDKFNLMVSNFGPYFDGDGRDLGSGILNAKLSLDAVPGGCASCIIDADCGDGNACTADICDPATGLCSNDPIAPCCGNGTCELGENCNTCPSDCFSASGAVCGNGICEVGDGENCVSCPADCNGKQTGKPSDRFCCGEGTCRDTGCTSGEFECTDNPVEPACCGDFRCEGSEDSFNCEVDCGAPPACKDAGVSCSSDADCCSNKCRGPKNGGKTCKSS